MTCLASVAIAVVITVTDAGWAAEGHLENTDDEERADFALLCDLDPVFILRCGDEREFAVTVHPALEDDRFTLTKYPGPESRPVSHVMQLQPAPRRTPAT